MISGGMTEEQLKGYLKEGWEIREKDDVFTVEKSNPQTSESGTSQTGAQPDRAVFANSGRNCRPVGQDRRRRKKKAAKTEGILSVSAASVMFLMTENMALPARFADGWSVAMVLFAVANVLLLLSVTDLKGVKSTE